MLGLETGDEGRALLQTITDQLEHVGIVGGIVGHVRQTKATFVGQRLQLLVVGFPEQLALGLNLVETL